MNANELSDRTKNNIGKKTIVIRIL